MTEFLKRAGAAIFSILIPASSFGADYMVSVESRYILSGETVNHISFDNDWADGGHGESELEFPLDDNLFAGINIVVSTDDGIFGLSYLGSVSGETGVMKDSDWIENDTAYGQPANNPVSERDLYTESDDDLRGGHVFDVNYRYEFNVSKNLKLGPIIGWAYQRFIHDVVGCKGLQWGSPVACVNETVIDFENSHRIPYIGAAGAALLGGRFTLRYGLLYSDRVRASYRDIHRYPDYDIATGDDLDRHFEGTLEGEALMAKFDGNWNISGNWLLGAGFEWNDIKTAGREKQEEYLNGILTAVSSGLIKSKLSTEFLSGYLRLAYRF
jgi:hypothetical protein